MQLTDNYFKAARWFTVSVVLCYVALGYWLMTMEVSDDQMTKHVKKKQEELRTLRFYRDAKRQESFELETKIRQEVEKKVCIQRLEMYKEIIALKVRIAELEESVKNNQIWWFYEMDTQQK